MKQSQLIILGVVVLVLVGGAIFMLSNKGGASPAPETANETVSPAAMELSPTTTTQLVEGTPGAMMEKSSGASGSAGAASTKAITVTGSNYSFDVKEIKVKKGDTVVITFKNADGMHDWVLDEFNAKTKTIGAGQQETVSFVADQVGTFEYYCSVGQHRKNGMFGKLIVE